MNILLDEEMWRFNKSNDLQGISPAKIVPVFLLTCVDMAIFF